MTDAGPKPRPPKSGATPGYGTPKGAGGTESSDGDVGAGPSVSKKRPSDPIESTLDYGPDNDMSSMDPDDPQGEKADYIELAHQFVKANYGLALVVFYKLTERGQQAKRDSKGKRVREFMTATGKSAAAEKFRGIAAKQPGTVVEIWISYATDSSSMKAGEFTPQRYINVAACVLYRHVAEKGRTSPVMKVIGGDQILAHWTTLTKLMVDEFDSTTNPKLSVAQDPDWSDEQKKKVPRITMTGSGVPEAGKEAYSGGKVPLYVKLAVDRWPAFTVDQTSGTHTDPSFLDVMVGGGYGDMIEPLYAHTDTSLSFTDRAFAAILFSGVDRCPIPFVNQGICAEVGAAIFALTDYRNRERGTISGETSAGVKKFGTDFFHSYCRRTKQLGVEVNTTLILPIVRNLWEMYKKFSIVKGDMPSDLTDFFNQELDKKYKETSYAIFKFTK